MNRWFDSLRTFSDDKDQPICAPVYKRKNERAKTQESVQSAPCLRLDSVEASLEAGRYESVSQFDSEVSSVFSALIREHGRVSALGAVAVQLKKVTC